MVDADRARNYSVARNIHADQWAPFVRRRQTGDDIAVIELTEKLEFSDYVQPICLPMDFRERPNVIGGHCCDGIPVGNFARVSSYCDWFQKETNGEVKCVDVEE